MKGIPNVLRTLLGVVFLLASFDKLQHPEAFAVIVEHYRILPPVLIAPVAILLPWLECLCGLGLIFNVLSRGAALVATVLMFVFLAALGFNAFRGLDVACGCFSTEPATAGSATLYLLRDAAIALLSLIVLNLQASELRKAR